MTLHARVVGAHGAGMYIRGGEQTVWNAVRTILRASGGREVRVGGLARGKVTFRRSRYAFWQTGFFNRFRLSYRSNAIGQPPESRRRSAWSEGNSSIARADWFDGEIRVSRSDKEGAVQERLPTFLGAVLVKRYGTF